jgi:hypothetical protein
MDISNAPPAHDGELYVLFCIEVQKLAVTLFSSGHGTEQENLRAEKEYEMAVTKGFRACLYRFNQDV